MLSAISNLCRARRARVTTPSTQKIARERVSPLVVHGEHDRFTLPRPVFRLEPATHSWPPELERMVHAYHIRQSVQHARAANRLQGAVRRLLDRRVPFVLHCFGGMGASEEQLREEARRLWTEKDHYDSWVLRLHSWCNVPRAFQQRQLDAEWEAAQAA